MKNVLRINHKDCKIIMDREFSIKASIYGSQEYVQLQGARMDYPDYKVERKTIRTNPHKEAFDGLTYDYMEKYMKRFNVDAEIRKQYSDMRFMAECHSIKYPVIKAWFLKTFPEVKEWGKFRNAFTTDADITIAA